MTESQIAEHQARVKKVPAMVNVGATDPIPPKIRMKGKDPEKELHRVVVQYLQQHRGIIVGSARMDKKSTFTKGWPDLSFAVSGRACAIELKVAGNAVTEEQASVHAEMRKNGWIVVVCESLESVRIFMDNAFVIATA